VNGYVEVNQLKELAKTTLREEQSKMILEFFQNPYIYIRSVTRQVAELAHEFTRTHGLRNADAVHVATAVIAKVDVLYTWDDPKQRRSGLIRHNMKIGNPPLRIEKPPDPDKDTLFENRPPAEEPSNGETPKAEPPATQS
jgi:hypothetical protein